MKRYIARFVLFIIGLLFAGIGVAFTRHGELGVSPISSVANVLNLRFPVLSMGNWLILWNCALIVLQVILLRRAFKLFQLLQIPLSFLFGYFTDFGVWIAEWIPVPNYGMRLVMLFAGILILGFGIALTVKADVILNSGEAAVKAISDKSGHSFGNVKIVFDISCVVLAVILSLLLFGGQIVGTREGTIISAVCTGFAVKLSMWALKRRFLFCDV